MKTIIVAIDFSDVTAKLIDTAKSLAKTLGAKLRIVHAAAPNPIFVGLEAGPQHERDFRAETLTKEHEKLNQMAEDLRDDGLDASFALREGATTEVLLHEVEQHNAGLLVIGSHGHGAVYSLVAGSTTLDVLKKTKIPVLVVPAKS